MADDRATSEIAITTIRRGRALREVCGDRRTARSNTIPTVLPTVNQGKRPTADPSAIARGFSLSTELVAGVLVAPPSLAARRWLGLSPWGMIVFLLLGSPRVFST